MCWNENVSLNTFIFTTSVLAFIWYNNTYTQYKLKDFKTPFLYLLFFTFTSMQLIEYFLWKSLKTKDHKSNQLFSMIGWIIIRIIQPLAILLIIPKGYDIIKYSLSIIYFLTLTIVSIYKQIYNPIDFTTPIDNNGHLYWKWLDLYNYERIVFVLYIIIFFTLILTYPIATSILLLLLVYDYFKYANFSSMWCWMCNSVLLYFLFKILFVLPYKEYNALC
jgi:hypothetical protein